VKAPNKEVFTTLRPYVHSDLCKPVDTGGDQLLYVEHILF